MNKTVNINLANIFFHIDEEAYRKLRNYLEAIKRSFAGTPGSDEIIADIEARLAELFHEKMQHERQVITEKEVDEVIAIMGQPEDYMIDEDIFEDEPLSQKEPKRIKKLYRDIDHKYIAGVSSGLGHYFKIDALWMRLLWILLTIGSSGGFILVYGLLWILIPEAVTTSQKLDMRGEEINISNIERKVKEGFDGVADKVKNADYDAMGNKIKSSGQTFFDTIGKIIMFFFKIIAKFIGIILIITGTAGIIALLVALFTVGVFKGVHFPGMDFYQMADATNTPIWLASLFIFFVSAIPLFFLLYLGLKILVNNLKSIGNIAKFSLLGLWLISLIALIVLGIQQGTARAFEGSATTKEELFSLNEPDTLKVALVSPENSGILNTMNIDDIMLYKDDDGNDILLSNDVQVKIEKSNGSSSHIRVRKDARGSSFNDARETAEKIAYDYRTEKNTIYLDNFLTTHRSNKFKDQEVQVNLAIPEGTVISYENNNNRCWTMRAPLDRNMNGCEMTKYLWQMDANGELICLNCPEENDDDDDDENSKGNNRIIINEEGVDIDIQDNQDSFKMKIDGDGVKIKANDNSDNVDINIDQKGVKVNTDEN
ncbi:PspC domain-containing protein [uncultured Kriegella sp.]|uniref:PspC domain-containing protein n=1 Tax=uncultured Kriegella sp. TaxID=1798910 RepID=UPI0030DB261E|tara:strand:- start:79010 stop:80803 length:1794 start_codon:yes stop_codon:yes gene_type:complete